MIAKLKRDTNKLVLEFDIIIAEFETFLDNCSADTITRLENHRLRLMRHYSPAYEPRLDSNSTTTIKYQKIKDFINNYCSFFSYDLLEKIFFKESEKCEELFKEYNERVAEYAKRQLFFFPLGSGIINESRAVVAVKLIEANECTGSHLVCFHETICELFKVKKWQLPINGVVKGCICINFHLPEDMKFKVFPLSSDILDSLKKIRCNEAKVLHISCENFQYDIQGK